MAEPAACACHQRGETVDFVAAAHTLGCCSYRAKEGPLCRPVLAVAPEPDQCVARAQRPAVDGLSLPLALSGSEVTVVASRPSQGSHAPSAAAPGRAVVQPTATIMAPTRQETV
jgi:hypothetical protein